MHYVCILGRQPALGLAELESRFGADALRPVNHDIVILDVPAAPVFDNFGGIMKAAELIGTSPTTDMHKLVRQLQKSLPEILQSMPEGKVTLGLSVHDFKTTVPQINAAALSLKKIIKAEGRSARIVPNKEPTLNTAQILHNNLAGPNGIELIAIRDNLGAIIGRTVWTQDIDSYRQRDQERPMRDARVGMLPPKLAQIILNIALGSAMPESSLKSNEASKVPVILDPFCGTGVLLQEAILQGCEAVGTDLEPRMVEYSEKNLEWLIKNTEFNASVHTSSGPENRYTVAEGDATTMQWSPMPDTIACETYLGRPFTSLPDKETLTKVIHDTNVIHKKFLQNVAKQTNQDFRLCIAVPAWAEKSGFKHLPVLDQLELLGYNRVSFVHAKARDLVYHRENQIVARELVVLTRT